MRKPDLEVTDYDEYEGEWIPAPKWMEYIAMVVCLILTICSGYILYSKFK